MISIICSFWWHSLGDGRGTTWVSWDTLCQSKAEGWLGFRNPFFFNQALLAKQSWRLLKYPGSLVARVLKHKYYPSTDLTCAKKGRHTSYGWQSLFYGRNLLLKGLRWQIGDWKSIRVFLDPWLPMPYSFKLITPLCFLHEQVLVADLINDGQW